MGFESAQCTRPNILASMNTATRHFAIFLASIATTTALRAQEDNQQVTPSLEKPVSCHACIAAEIAALAKDGETAKPAAGIANYYATFAERFHHEVGENGAARSGQRVLRALAAADRAERFANRANSLCQRGARGPNRPVPTRTRVAPHSMAVSRSAVMPMDSVSRFMPASFSSSKTARRRR